jgi:hypothetical protein
MVCEIIDSWAPRHGIARELDGPIDPTPKLANVRERTPGEIDESKGTKGRRPTPRVRPRRLVAVVNRRPMDSTAPAALRGLSAQGRR